MCSQALPPPTPAHLRGDELYGEDFNREQVECWFRLNAPGYSEKSGESLKPSNYGYHEVNRQALYHYIRGTGHFGMHWALVAGTGQSSLRWLRRLGG